MNALDLIMMGIIAVSLLYSAWKGFIRDAFSLAGLVGGFLVASRFYPLAGRWLSSWVPYPWMTLAFGWLLIFLMVYVALAMLGRMVRGSLTLLRIGWVDRVAGLLFGFLKGVLLCAALLVVLVAFLPPESPFLKDSRLAPRIMEVIGELGRWAPGEIGERFREPPEASRGNPSQRQAGANGKDGDGRP